MVYPIYGTPGILPDSAPVSTGPLQTTPGIIPSPGNSTIDRLQGLLTNPMFQMGIGILGNNQGNYGAFGPAVSKGLLHGMQNIQQQKEAEMRQKYYDLQMEKAQRELDNQKNREEAIPRLIQGEKAYTQNQQVPVTSFQNVPIPAVEGAVAPNYGLQRQEVTTMQEQPVFNQELWMRDMVASGLGDDLIKQRFQPREGNFDIAPNGVMYDKKTGQVVEGQKFAKPESENLPNDVREYQFALTQGFPGTFRDYQIEQKKAGASRTNVNVSTDKKYGEILGTKMAEQDAASIDAARTAPDRIASARRVQDILDKNPTTGSGAEARLSIEKAFATAGLVDGNNVKNTEDLAAELASTTLEAIKSSGLGSGQGFTDKDRQFLERARAGNIEVNAQTLRRLAYLNELSAVRSIERGNAVIKKLKADPSLGDVAGRLEEVPVPSAEGASQTIQPPKQAINALRMNPKLRVQFDQKYGPGASDRVLRRK